MTAQILIIALFSVNLLMAAHKHGKPKEEGTHNFWYSFFSVALYAGILYLGWIL